MIDDETAARVLAEHMPEAIAALSGAADRDLIADTPKGPFPEDGEQPVQVTRRLDHLLDLAEAMDSFEYTSEQRVSVRDRITAELRKIRLTDEASEKILILLGLIR